MDIIEIETISETLPDAPEQSMSVAEKRHAYYVERRRKLKEEGLCTVCAFRPAREDRTMCVECSKARKEESTYSYLRTVTLRLCSKCKQPLPEGYDYINCPECRKKVNAYLAEYRARKKAELAHDLEILKAIQEASE